MAKMSELVTEEAAGTTVSDRDSAALAFSSLLDVPRRLSDVECRLAEVLSALATITRVLPPALVPVKEAGRLLGVSVPTVRRLVKKGDVKAVKVGGSLRIDLTAVRPANDIHIAQLVRRAKEGR